MHQGGEELTGIGNVSFLVKLEIDSPVLDEECYEKVVWDEVSQSSSDINC
jgi:hypothetical protein